MRWGIAVLVVLAAGCSSATPAAPGAAELRAVSVRISNLSDPIPVGVSVVPQAVVTMSDGSERIVAGGTGWSSSNGAVVTVDASGVVTAVGEGEATLALDVKNARGTSGVLAIPNVSGTWDMAYIPASCPFSVLPGCAGTRFTGPVVISEQLTLTQQGDRVSGEWRRVRFSGRISRDGVLTLDGNLCTDHDFAGHVQSAIVGWWMSRRADGTFSGQMRWEQNTFAPGFQGCGGPQRNSSWGDLLVREFRRVSQ